MLKLKFDAHQEYQRQAIDSIVDIFNGQTINHSKFTALIEDRGMYGKHTELGYGNKLDLIDEDLLSNVVKIQDDNHLTRSTKLKDEQYEVPNFAIEMETGTGKTYVYTRTILELNKKYGFTKFVIVVPSVAIREGVHKSLQITEEHFKENYPGQSFNYFVYNSSKLNDVRSFATSEAIEIMIINIDAFKKAFDDNDNPATIFHKDQDKLGGRKPREFVQQTNPIVIIDEPQSVDNTPKAKESIKSLNPLCILRYSATHKDSYNLMHRLGPIEACEHNLVKKIAVYSVTGFTPSQSHIRLISTSDRAGTITAKVEINVRDKKGQHKLKIVTVNTGAKGNLFELSGENDEYKDMRITNIGTRDPEFIEINEHQIIEIGQAKDDLDVKRLQIRLTIESHLDRETILLDQGIKVLSLFFIDKVANYRESTDGEPGIYAQIFEEEYLRLIQLPRYQHLFRTEEAKKYALNDNVSEVHDGYFSQDKKVNKDTKGNTKADESTYELIMKDKERLLSRETKLRFIFSHSALREGWDNPNVFQICTLIENKDDMTKRQKVGRGLRLAVNQYGDRIHDEQVNILTVIANESFESFAESLQKEIEAETNTKFGILRERAFEDILIQTESGTEKLGYDKSKEIFDYLQAKDLIDKKGKLSQELKEAVVKGALELPSKFEPIVEDVIKEIKETQKRLPLLNAKEKTHIKIKKEVLLSPDFIEFWDKIKHKTFYRLAFDNTELIKSCTEALSKMPEIKMNPVIGRWVKLQIEEKGITTTEPSKIRELIRDKYQNKKMPDILQYVEQFTRLKRKSIADILIGSGTLDNFYANPQEYMQKVVEIIDTEKRKIMIEGIKYEKVKNEEFYCQTQFESKELVGYLKDNAIPVSRGLYSHVLYDSNIEKSFAERLDNDDDVKMFTKLPSWFEVDTPLGPYNPDWMVLLDKNGEEKLYFIVETKGSIKDEDLRMKENAKIKCGEKHFEALGTGVKFSRAKEYEEWRLGV